jgi:amino acid adenylation domain-containing protein
MISVTEIIQALKRNNVTPVLRQGQLVLSGDTATLSVDFLQTIRTNKPALISFLQAVNNRSPSRRIEPVSKATYYPLTNAQKRIWVLSQFDGGNAAYKIVTTLMLEGTIDIEILNRAFQLLVQRHESLRTFFREIDGEVRQVIEDQCEFNLGYKDIRHEMDIRGYLQEVISASAKLEFDLEKGPLLNAQILRLGTDRYAMLLAVHHIISDGWSIGVLLKDLMEFNAMLLAGKSDQTVPLVVQYKDYAQWLSENANDELTRRASTFWKNTLSPSVPLLDIPTDFPRPAIRTFDGAILKMPLTQGLHKAILEFCSGMNVTSFNFFRATLSILLCRLSGQQEIILGTPVSGRSHLQLENQIGLFVNTLPLKTTVTPALSFIDFVKEISRNSEDSFQFQHFPFDTILQELDVKSEPSRNPLFDVMMVIQDTATRSMLTGIQKQPGFELSLLDSFIYEPDEVISEKRNSKFDLIFNFCTYPNNSFYLEIEYCTALYTQATIDWICRAYRYIILQVLDSPARAIAGYEIVLPEEKEKLLFEFNNTVVPYPREKTVVMLVEEQVSKTPDSIALVYGKKTLTYRELNTTANRFARYLQARYDLQPNHLVGIQVARNEWLVITMLAVLKAGAAYVPIDPAYPAERIDYMVRDCQSKVLVDEVEINRFLLDEYNYPNHDSVKRNCAEDLVYVIYTSGSTGEPKGSMVMHHSFTNLVLWYGRLLAISADDTFLLLAPISFDLAQKNVFAPLIFGAKLCLPEQHFDYEGIAQTIAHESVTVVNVAPSAFYPLLDVNVNSGFSKLTSLKKIVLGGEPIKIKEFIPWINSGYCKADVINSYGPTECTDVVSYHVASNNELTAVRTIPIGKAIDNTSLYILTPANQLLPVGFVGEICIGGACVGKGYLRRNTLTSEKFVPNPFRAGEKMYRTGDLGKWLPSGDIEYLGRIDNQLKIRGFRIELGEIENALLKFPHVTSALVMAVNNKDGEPQLAAYIVTNKKQTAADLRAFLVMQVPSYMIPGYFVFVTELPLTPSGKIDRKALPDPFTAGWVSREEMISPRNGAEEVLVSIWQDVLGIQSFGVKENFFELGGNSISILKMVSHVNKAFNKKISPITAFRYPNIESLANYIVNQENLSTSHEDNLSEDVMMQTLTLVNRDINED